MADILQTMFLNLFNNNYANSLKFIFKGRIDNMSALV